MISNVNELYNHIKIIVKKSTDLKNKYTKEFDAKVNYACIFCQNDKEYNRYIHLLKEDNNKVLEETNSGPLFRIKDLDTVSGILKLVKIRKYDKAHNELGDADFTVKNYSKFKEYCLNKNEFKIISRDNYEMIELMESNSDVRVYFSNPPIDEELGI